MKKLEEAKKEVRIEVDRELFKDLVFHFDVLMEDGQKVDSFKEIVIKYKGKVAQRFWDKKITHIVWCNGGEKSLEKAKVNESKIELVSTLWITQCLKEAKLLKEDNFRPVMTEMMIGKSNKEKIDFSNAINHRKRKLGDPNQLTMIEAVP